MQFHVFFFNKLNGMGFGGKCAAKGDNGVAFSRFKELVQISCNGMNLNIIARPQALENLEEGVFKTKHIDAVGLALDFEGGEEGAGVVFV